jgi:hypothetical protein
MMKIYAFDVDETLEVSEGPIPLEALKNLVNEGHIVGLCGNWAVVTNRVWKWWHWASFIGPMGITKEDFLIQLKKYIPVEEVVMVGNILGVSGRSDDQGAAERAGVRFISEKDFAEGKR